MADYNTADRKRMASEGTAMPDGSYPIANAADLQNAIHAVGRGSGDHDAIRRHIIKRAKALGKSDMIPDGWGADGSMSDDSSRTEPTSFTRTWDLADCSVRTEGDGRTVEAYAAIFDTPASVRDHEGEYTEVIDRHAFDSAVQSMRGPLPVLFNHGKTLYGTPSERYSIPIGVSEEVRPDKRGLYTRSRFHKTEAADEILEAIRDGSITSYSFQGQFTRSDPLTPRGGFRRRGRDLPTVRRTECTLREYGPGTFAVYKEAAIMGVRAEDAAWLINSLETSERSRLIELLQVSGDGLPDLGDTVEEIVPAGDTPERVLSVRQRIQAGKARFLSAYGGTL